MFNFYFSTVLENIACYLLNGSNYFAFRLTLLFSRLVVIIDPFFKIATSEI